VAVRVDKDVSDCLLIAVDVHRGGC
jgi:hypothetical protein